MKLMCNSIFIFFLFITSFFLYPSEYYSTYHMPVMELHGNLSQPKINTLPNLHFRAKYLSNMIQRNTAPQLHNRMNQTIPKQTEPVVYADPSYLINHLSSSIKSERHKILNRFMENDPEIHRSSLKKYPISSLSKQYLAFNNIDINSMESCTGNMLQQTIHQEFIMLTDATAHLWNQQLCSQEVKNLTTVIGNFIDAGVCFNRTGEVKKALTLADASWTLFDCILAAGEGVIDGVATVIHDITHPIQTAQNFVNATISCGYYLGIALQEMGCITSSLISGDFNIAHNKYTHWREHFKNITYALDEYSQQLTIRDAVKTITSSLVQCYATTRAINGFSSLFNNAHQSAISIAKKITEGAQESTLLISAEGIPLRIAQETLKQIKKVPRAQDKLLQALAQFEGQIIRVGNVRCLLDKNGLKHILERHHPQYWEGTLKDLQTFFNKNITIPNIVDIIKKTIKQNRKLILQKGTLGKYQITGVFKNKKYIVGFDNGRIRQFYISLK